MVSVRIPLNSRKFPGLFAIIDEEDYCRVMQHRWSPRKSMSGRTFYAQASLYVNKRTRTISLHRFVMNAPRGVQVDHKDGNGLDCQKSNLRFANQSQNKSNTPIYGNNTSGYTGVTWVDRDQRWYVQVNQKNVGIFANKEEAARCRDVYALIMQGEFARYNFTREAAEQYLIDHPELLEPSKPQASQYRGVTWTPRLSKWRVRIKYNNEDRSLGHFADEEEAHRVYEWARAYALEHGHLPSRRQ